MFRHLFAHHLLGISDTPVQNISDKSTSQTRNFTSRPLNRALAEHSDMERGRDSLGAQNFPDMSIVRFSTNSANGTAASSGVTAGRGQRSLTEDNTRHDVPPILS